MSSALTLISLFIILGLSNCEVIKLQNKTHILCITDNPTFGIYLNPPVVSDLKNSSILIENNDLWDDWVLKNSLDVVVPYALDKRWEDFETIYTNSIYFPSVLSMAFSVNTLGISVVIDDPPMSLKTTRSDFIGWLHNSGYSTNPETNEYVRFAFNATAPTDAYWKIHDYNLRWVGTISEEVTVVPVSPDDASCVDLYVYLCLDCVLEVQVAGNIYNFQGERNHEWKNQRFFIDSETNISFNRTMVTEQTNGEWAVDIRRCPLTKSNRTIYEVSLEKDIEEDADRTCYVGITQNREHSKMAEKNTNLDIFSCNPGILGMECDLNCEELLSPESKYCEEYEICDDSFISPQCFCSWGYQGPSCNQGCSNGAWGLSCEQKCYDCELCNGNTGECIKP